MMNSGFLNTFGIAIVIGMFTSGDVLERMFEIEQYRSKCRLFLMNRNRRLLLSSAPLMPPTNV